MISKVVVPVNNNLVDSVLLAILIPVVCPCVARRSYISDLIFAASLVLLWWIK